MKAFICSIQEATTQICCDQMERFGYDVILLDQKESIADKYKRFIKEASKIMDYGCVKVDADIIPNENIRNICSAENILMKQYAHYDLYKNKVSIGNPVYYKNEAIEIIKKNLDKISEERPETSAWRLPEIIDHTTSEWTICGVHGFFQYIKDIKRAEQNKKDRRQIQHFDFELVNKLYNL